MSKHVEKNIPESLSKLLQFWLHLCDLIRHFVCCTMGQINSARCSQVRA